MQIADYHAYPDAHGRFGPYGGTFVAETLIAPLEELTAAYTRLRDDPAFQREFTDDLKHYVGRPSPIYHARRLSQQVGGAQILLKREDLNHTGAHKINNTVGQALVARAMGKRRIIAETGAGQHGVATATVCARFGMKCVVYMGAVDIERQKINVYRMKLLGAEVVPVRSGSQTLKDALNEALCESSARKRRGRVWPRAGTQPRLRQAAPACCTATARTFSAMTTARSPKRIRSRRVSTIPASAPSTRS